MFDPLDDGFKRIIGIWHRRSGKDKSSFNAITMKAFEEVGNYFYMLPTATQGRKVIWQSIGKDGMHFLDHIPKELLYKKPNDTEMLITLKHPTKKGEPGSTIQVVGSDNFNHIMGSNPRGIVFSEYSIMNPLAWEYLRPILLENGGWAVFIYTPRGSNHGKKLYDVALANPDTWYASMLDITDTGVLTREDVINEMAQGMSYEMAQQEFYCSFEGAVPGSIYGRLMSEARNEKRIVTPLALEPGVPVHTFWDSGVTDSTAIWFAQIISEREIRIVDYYENSGEGIPHYHGILQAKALERNFVYGEHYGPHDLEHVERFNAMSTIEQAAGIGLEFDIVENVGLWEGVEMARAIFPKIWFDAKHCEGGIAALDNYRKKWDEVNKAFASKPQHDWSSHGADAFRYMAVAYQVMRLRMRSPRNRVGKTHKQSEVYNPFHGSASRGRKQSRPASYKKRDTLGRR